MERSRIAFRPMKMADLPMIMEVERASFPTPWPKEAFVNELLHSPFAHYTVVTVDGEIAGYCGMWIVVDEAHITNIAIHPKYRGKKLGQATLAYMKRLARLLGADKMTLEVRVSNHVAQHVYRKLGFEAKGIRPRYYSDNQEDALIMWVTLDEDDGEHTVESNQNTGTGD
ncbi:ribosomal protein S18-alanine N-acetyltransferase [Polycladomyces subterraneus]|uniref:Ribosomal protein S18-alanine N-acetyltransferase n=1 Tax=Polycladomyces subterraneus TaxID=1016997 RepID=A0ABT8IP57_9BACL|nr:ribosomal protein S18-alanine N-acetyltransferase [Polycladomyces subterraneus]MDN4594570.1 ribosomal protein S18-alanine N-acetyltransferase [Polycladomyces subterraneus]